MADYVIKQIAYIENDFKEKFGVPRQSGRAPSVVSKIVFLPEFRNDDSLRGIEEFSHLWLIFDFSKSHKQDWSPLIRPPRLGGNEKVGVFASRSPFRPNNLGLSSVKLVKTEQTANGIVLIVEGVDILDGTPIYDIKPYLPSDCHVDAKGSYSVNDHRLKVIIDDRLSRQIDKDKLDAIFSCIEDDPRPSYQNDEQRIYSMRFDNLDVSFKVENQTATIIDIKDLK